MFGVGPILKQKMPSNSSQYPKDAQNKQSMMGYGNMPPGGERPGMMGGMQQMNPNKIPNQPNNPAMLNPNMPTNPVEKTSSGKKTSTPFIVENPLYSQSNPNNPPPNSGPGGPGGSTYPPNTNTANAGNPANQAATQQPTSIQKTKSSGNANAALLTSPAATTTQKNAPANADLNTSQSKAGVTGKPSEIPTQSLRIGSNKFPGCKISTKIHFGKKQFVWEVAETASPTKPADGEEAKQTKKKFEVKFSDIEKIDVNTDTQTITIDTKEKPNEYKEINQQPKKTTQWIKDEKLLNDDNAKVIVAVFGKEVLTKTGAGKQSHLDKIKGCELPLTINGVKYINTEAPKPVAETTTVPAIPSNQANNLTTQISIPNVTSYPSGQSNAPTAAETNPLQIAMKKSDVHPTYPDTMVDISIARGASRNTQPQSNAIPPEDIEEGGPGLEEIDEEEEFPLLTKERKQEIKKFEGILKNMKPEDKIEMILDVIKPERQDTEAGPGRKLFKCPVDKCGKSSQNANALKKHFQQNHKKLLEMGLDVDSVGNFQWKTELLDFCIMVAKIYPKFVKNVVRQSKRNK